jgi:uncharacterized protein YraI
MPPARHRAEARPAALLRSTSLARVTGIASVVTATVVTVGLATGASDTDLTPSAADAGATVGSIQALQASREERVSRSAQRTAGRVALAPRPVDHQFATEPLNLWTGPVEKGPKVGLLKEGTKVAVTGQTDRGWAEVLMTGPKGKELVRWVNAKYLSEEKPQPETGPEAGISTAPCPDGSEIEGGLTPAADVVYRAVCAAFPQPTTYGGLDPHGEHVDGRAIDVMVSGELGWQIAEWLRANAARLQIRDIIYSQRIWTPEQASSGWRPMSDRGSITANHYDHVHVAVF